MIARRLSLKSARRVETVAREFQGVLLRMADGVWRYGSNQNAFERSMVLALSQYMRESYIAGFKYGGGNEEDLDDADESFIKSSIRTQLPYIPDFAAAVFAAVADEDAQEVIAARISMWTSNVRSMGDSGQASVNKNQVMEFKRRPDLRNAKETCRTRGATQGCAEMLGRRMRWKDIMARGLQVYAGNPAYACKGWRCVHGWYPVKAAA